MGYITTLVNDFENKFLYIRIQGLESDSLKQLQEEVGGYVDVCNWLFPKLSNKNIDCWIADDGYGKPETVSCMGQTIRGNLVFAKHDGEGETLGLEPLECLEVINSLKEAFDGVVPVQMSLNLSERFEWMDYLSDGEECAEA